MGIAGKPRVGLDSSKCVLVFSGRLDGVGDGRFRSRLTGKII